jgi:hypothetical protein
MNHALQEDHLEALKAVGFPAPRDRILSAVKEMDGFSEPVVLILEQLPDRTYESLNDLTGELECAEVPMSIEGEVQSGNEAGVIGATKDLIADATDPTPDSN